MGSTTKFMRILGVLHMIEKAIKRPLAARREKAKNAQTIINLLDTVAMIHWRGIVRLGETIRGEVGLTEIWSIQEKYGVVGGEWRKLYEE